MTEPGEVWQRQLDEEFPDGAKITIVNDVPEDTTDSVAFLTTYLRVLSVEDGVPTVQVYPVTFDKEVLFTIAKREEWGDDGWLVTQVEDDAELIIIDHNFDVGIAKVLRSLRDMELENSQ